MVAAAAPNGTVKATLTLASATSGQDYTSALPCQNWSLLGPEASPTGYKYADKALNVGTVIKLAWRRAKDLKATFTGKGAASLAYDLEAGISQNPLRGEIVSGDVGVCFACASAKRDGSDGRSFSAKAADCPAPAACGP